MVVPNGDIDQTAEALVSLLSDRDRASSLGAAAREAVANCYSWAQRARELEEVYDRVHGCPS